MGELNWELGESGGDGWLSCHDRQGLWNILRASGLLRYIGDQGTGRLIPYIAPKLVVALRFYLCKRSGPVNTKVFAAVLCFTERRNFPI